MLDLMSCWLNIVNWVRQTTSYVGSGYVMLLVFDEELAPQWLVSDGVSVLCA